MSRKSTINRWVIPIISACAIALPNTEMAIAVLRAQLNLEREVISDGSVPIPTLLRANDELVIVEFAARLRPGHGELHLPKTLSDELDGLSTSAPFIALVSLTGSRSFLTRKDTDIDTWVSVAVRQTVRTSKLPFQRLGTEFDFLQGGGELTIGHTRIRIKGYTPFTIGGRYVMWFVKSSDTQPIVAVDWISVDDTGRLVNSTPPTWRDLAPARGATHLFGLPAEWLIDELRKRQEK